MEYKVVTNNNKLKFEAEITDLLCQGWELHGSLQTNVSDERWIIFTQALVRKGVSH